MASIVGSKEQDNLLRWDGKKKGYFEIYFLKWNDEQSRTAGWIRYTLTSPLARVGPPRCELWGIFFDVENPEKNFAVKQRYSIDRLSWNRDPFSVRIADAELSTNACHAAIADEDRGHSFEWDLTFDSTTPTYYYFPWQVLYKTAFPKTKVICPHPDARFSGKLVADGREITLHNAPGQQEHAWGAAQHGVRWAWGQCNIFKEDPSAIWEGIDVLLNVGLRLDARFKLFYLKAGERTYRFNALHQWVLNRSRWDLGHWAFEASSRDARLTGEVTSRFDDFVGVTYEEPDGGTLWCNNSKVSSVRLQLSRPDGSPIAELTSNQGCAAEYVDRKIYPQVPIRI